MILEDIDKENCPDIVVTGEVEVATCKYCGRRYPSRGKYETYVCNTCKEWRGTDNDNKRSNP